MKKALLLFAALLVAGCGEKSSSEGSESASESPTPSNESAEPSADTAKPIPAEPPVAESPSGEPSESPNSLSDADVERLLKEAVNLDPKSFEEREGLLYLSGESEPYSGRLKEMYDSGQVARLIQFKDGVKDGLQTQWRKNGQKDIEETYKGGKVDGLHTTWHANGQKRLEINYKDGKRVDGSTKFWNSTGERVETFDESSE